MMKRILFSVGINAVEALGTVTRMVAIANEVRKIKPDTEILFRSSGSEAEYVSNFGFNSVDGFKPNIMGFSDPVWKIITKLQGEWDGKVPAMKRIDDLIRLKGIFTKKFTQTTYTEWMNILEAFQPDVIVSEFDLIATIIARKTGTPHFSTYGTVGNPEYFSELFFTKPQPDLSLCTHYNRLLTHLGLPKIRLIQELFCGYDHSKRLIPSIPEMEDIPEDETTHYIGDLIPENFSQTSWDWNKKRPLIYVYLSIGQISAELAERVLIETFAKMDVDVIVAGAGHPYFEKRGEYRVGNVQFHRVLPADKVLESADLAIHHGGQNTTLQCIKAQVPALIFPGLHFERYYNARKAADLGCAHCLKVEDFSMSSLNKHYYDVLENNPHKDNLAKYSARIKELGGSKKAAALVL
jgi:UDP:flavonoid glycosyltransferase YjiC (YdhE family)